jgi:Domain of unknown function (DUF4124)
MITTGVTMQGRHRIALPALLAAAILAAGTVCADIYKSVDKDGNVVFSDQPARDAEPVKLGPTNAMQAPADAAPRAEPGPGTGDAAPFYQALDITSPADGSTVNNPGGNVLVLFGLSPPLREGDSTRLLIDGTPGGMPAEGGLLAPGTSRGEHTLEVQVLDAGGTVLRTSAPVRVTVFRSPIRDKPGRPRTH